MNALIFGINSQDGYYLKLLLEKQQIKVFGISRSIGDWIQGSVANRDFVNQLIKQYKPEYIFHIGANSTTHHDALWDNHEVVATGTLNILESVKQHSTHSKVFITGSGVQFKNKGIGIKETDDFEASSTYAIARIHSIYAARYYRSLGIKTYVGYLFHHESPLRKPKHISQQIASFVKNIDQNTTEKLYIGDSTITKEWGFAGDIVKGIWMLVEQNNIFEATIGTGKIYSIQDWIELCFSLKNLNYEDFVSINEIPFQSEYKTLQSNPETIFKIGWKPTISFQQLGEMMMK